VDYDSTDVLGVAEVLPFRDGAFDAVLSIAVLEHVRDPFRAAAEIVRVLKPGGKLICAVPFLQPLHGYPHHYYNMTHQGLRALFERGLQVDRQTVPDSTLPIWALTWVVQSWANGLPPGAREQFLDLRIRELIAGPESFLKEAFVRLLPPERNFELASGTVLFATKRPC
jgi:SAM-dependent methyltransferase